jgi:signal transduction histidine kinase
LTEAVRTLLVEDNPGDARLLREMLPEGFSLTHVERLDAAIAAAAGHEVVLLDLSLPDGHGLETFRRFHAAAPEVAVLVLTALADDEAAVQAVREGAQDWLVKGRVDAEGLGRALRYAIERNRLSARLRELDRMRSLFLSVVSHDLKSPVAAILAGIDLLLAGRIGELNARQRHALEVARRNALRQTRLVNDLLDVAVIEAGAMVLHPATVTLGALVDATLEELGPLVAERNLTLSRDFEPTPVIRGDADRIAQAVANLVTNAAKFARREIAVRVRASSEGVSIVVEDDGPGIAPDLVGHLFDRFVRGEGPRAGSGLGLSIVRGVAEAHHGAIHAENRIEGGARFIVTFPQ